MEYKTYWDKVEKNPNNYRFKSIKDAFDHLKSEPNVILSSTVPRVLAYYKKHRDFPEIKMIKEPMPSLNGILLPKYSPLTPTFRFFGIILNERGLHDNIMKKWFGDIVQSQKSENTKVLSFKDLFLGFVILIILATISISMMGGEIILNFKKIQKKTAKRQRPSRIPIRINGNYILHRKAEKVYF